MTHCKCILILSEKSSGSSLCRKILSDFAGAQHIRHTRHYEFETLYWTKAASLLGLPQRRMVDSEVPLPACQARRDLLRLLQENLRSFSPPPDDRDLIFGGWRKLCEAYQPIFVEKSPHHLVQWSAIELILEFIQQNPDIEFLFLGLIRNPMDTLYSQFRRWRSRPEDVQSQWIAAYQNLLKLKDRQGDQVILLRYEDMVQVPQSMQAVFDFCEQPVPIYPAGYLRSNPHQPWREDPHFGFALDEEASLLAERFGYTRESMFNPRGGDPLWPLYRETSRIFYKGKTLIKSARLSFSPSAATNL